MAADKIWDVIVCGGGLTGVCAATAAARNQARTLLVEQTGVLGGTMTNNLVGPMMSFHSAKEQVIRGLAQEVVDRLIALGASPGHVIDNTGYVETVTPFDNEVLKLVAQRMVLESGAELLYHAHIEDVILQGQTIQGLVIRHKGGVEKLFGRVMIDSSGDADVAYLSGAPCEMGRASDGLVQPVSLMFKVGPVNLPAVMEYMRQHPDECCLGEKGTDAYLGQQVIAVCGFSALLQRSIQAGEIPLRREDVLFFSSGVPDEVTINMSRIAGVNPLDAWDLTRAEVVGREQVYAIMAFLRSKVIGFEKAHILSTGTGVGIRESRRVMGEYVLTQEDVLQNRHFADAILRNSYPIDIHASTPDDPYGGGFVEPGQFYEIPYRCLVPQKVEQLLVAGRCISTTHEAQGSIRTSPTCMAMGQAAGTAAALSIREETSPRNIKTDLVRQVLVQQGAFL